MPDVLTRLPGSATRVEFDRDVEERLDEADRDADYSGWWCVATAPFPCPAARCDFVALYMTAAHLIVVWPRKDDVKLLTAARNAREAGRNPRVVEYERSFGPCVSWDAWVRAGRPVHGQIPEPDRWGERTPPL